MPGVRLTPAVVIALEIGDVTRFSHRGKLAGYAGSRSVAMRDVQGEPTLGSTNAPAAGEPATASSFNATGVAWRVARSPHRIMAGLGNPSAPLALPRAQLSWHQP
jgi:hypothetical protein